MAVITARALVVLAEGKSDDEMIYVKVKDPTGHRYGAKIASIMASSYKPTVDLLAEDGEMVFGVPLPRIQFVDVRPHVEYPLMSTAEFVNSALPGEEIRQDD